MQKFDCLILAKKKGAVAECKSSAAAFLPRTRQTRIKRVENFWIF
jgi:hypothetical protein